jgi:hypothetical protein
MNKLFPIQLHQRDEKFIATTALTKLAEDPDRTNAQLHELAEQYTHAIAEVRAALATIQRGAPERGRAFWSVGQIIEEFERALQSTGFYLPAQAATFARDLGMAEGTLRKITAFHRRNPDVNALDASDPYQPRANRRARA